jgi:dephospho-CoA kinase
LSWLMGLRIVGLTGGISSGKSTVTRALQEERRAFVVDFDLLAREVVQPGTVAFNKIVARFGAEVVKGDLPCCCASDVKMMYSDVIVSVYGCVVSAEDGTLDRPKLAKICFGDKKALADIAAFQKGPIWRLFLSRTLRALLLDGAKIVVLDAPLLFEAKLHWFCEVSQHLTGLC